MNNRGNIRFVGPSHVCLGQKVWVDVQAPFGKTRISVEGESHVHGLDITDTGDKYGKPGGVAFVSKTTGSVTLRAQYTDSEGNVESASTTVQIFSYCLSPDSHSGDGFNYVLLNQPRPRARFTEPNSTKGRFVTGSAVRFIAPPNRGVPTKQDAEYEFVIQGKVSDRFTPVTQVMVEVDRGDPTALSTSEFNRRAQAFNKTIRVKGIGLHRVTVFAFNGFGAEKGMMFATLTPDFLMGSDSLEVEIRLPPKDDAAPDFLNQLQNPEVCIRRAQHHPSAHDSESMLRYQFGLEGTPPPDVRFEFRTSPFAPPGGPSFKPGAEFFFIPHGSKTRFDLERGAIQTYQATPLNPKPKMLAVYVKGCQGCKNNKKACTNLFVAGAYNNLLRDHWNGEPMALMGQSPASPGKIEGENFHFKVTKTPEGVSPSNLIRYRQGVPHFYPPKEGEYTLEMVYQLAGMTGPMTYSLAHVCVGKIPALPPEPEYEKHYIAFGEERDMVETLDCAELVCAFFDQHGYETRTNQTASLSKGDILATLAAELRKVVKNKKNIVSVHFHTHGVMGGLSWDLVPPTNDCYKLYSTGDWKNPKRQEEQHQCRTFIEEYGGKGFDTIPEDYVPFMGKTVYAHEQVASSSQHPFKVYETYRGNNLWLELSNRWDACLAANTKALAADPKGAKVRPGCAFLELLRRNKHAKFALHLRDLFGHWSPQVSGHQDTAMIQGEADIGYDEYLDEGLLYQRIKPAYDTALANCHETDIVFQMVESLLDRNTGEIEAELVLLMFSSCLSGQALEVIRALAATLDSLGAAINAGNMQEISEKLEPFLPLRKVELVGQQLDIKRYPLDLVFVKGLRDFMAKLLAVASVAPGFLDRAGFPFPGSSRKVSPLTLALYNARHTPAHFVRNIPVDGDTGGYYLLNLEEGGRIKPNDLARYLQRVAFDVSSAARGVSAPPKRVDPKAPQRRNFTIPIYYVGAKIGDQAFPIY